DYRTLDMLTESLIISTSAVPIYDEKGGFHFNDPDEGALVTLAMKNNMSTETIRNENYCVERRTNPETGIVTSVHINPKKQRVIYIRGAARSVVELCEFIRFEGKDEKINRKIREEIEHKIIEMAADGFKSEAIAYSVSELGKEREKGKYVLLGLLGIYDPPKPEVKKIVEECKAAGIKIVIITEESSSSA
ncbi:MAG: hypothetical protein QW112_03525, partial [Candidatus Micrarchaeia archaeon]